MRDPRRALAVALCLTAAPGASAEELHGPSAAAFSTREALVSVELGRGHARLVYRRTLHNGGSTAAPVRLSFDLPAGGAVTGFRVLEDDRSTWRDADLLEAGEAADLYRAFMTRGAAPSTASPTLLAWGRVRELDLTVTTVPPNGDRTVELAITRSTDHEQGQDVLYVAGEKGAPPVVVTAARRGDRLFADGRPLVSGAQVRPPEEGIRLSLQPAGVRGLGGALAVVPLAEGRALVSARVEAGRLADAPRGARVVVLIDTSRSLADGEIRAAAAAARAYLSHLPGALVETLLFDRRVTAVHGGFVPVGQARAALDRLSFTRRNGSRVDDALARAAGLFDGVPADAPRRIVIFTDGLTRRSLDPEALGPLAARSGAVVHAAIAHGRGTPALARDDGHPWTTALRPTGGLAWSSAASDEPEAEAEMRAVFEELARPLRVDRLRVAAPGIAYGAPESLREGERWSDARLADRAAPWIAVEGELWSRPISTRLFPDRREAVVSAALAAGSRSAALDLGDDDTRTLARLGHVLSPATSFLITRPGLRPPFEEDDVARGEIVGGATCGCGRPSFDEWVGLPDSASPEPEVAALQHALRPGWAACGGGGRVATVTIETVRGEVVDVGDPYVSGPGGEALAPCLVEAAWSVELPEAFDVGRRVLDVAL